MNQKGEGRFMQGLCPYGAGAPTPGFIALGRSPVWRACKKGKGASRRHPFANRMTGPATALGSLPSVALSSARALISLPQQPLVLSPDY